MIHHFHPLPLERIEVGAGVALVVLPPDGDRSPLGIEHVCARWPDDQEPDGELAKCVSPRLHPDHVVHELHPPTITASILCPDCGLHGYITEGAWR